MFSEGKAMDAITIYDSLNDNDNLEAIGGSDYLLELQADTLVPAHSEYYCNILCDKYKLLPYIVGRYLSRRVRTRF